MLPLAQWLMRGQGQALAFVVVCFSAGIIFWPLNILAAAGLSLVTLRHGTQTGITVGLLALVPAILIGISTNTGGAYLPALLVLGTLISSEVLRQSRSWSFTLLALTLSAFGSAALVMTVFSNDLDAQVKLLQEVLTSITNELAKQDPEQAKLLEVIGEYLNTTFVAGLWGALVIVINFLGLILGRSWQAGLYNPGGFQQEFHQLRLGRADTLVYLGLSLGALVFDASMMTWSWISMLPLTVSAIALFHWLAKYKEYGQHWYIIFYALLIISDFMRLILVLVALLDVSIDFRKRLSQRTDDNSDIN